MKKIEVYLNQTLISSVDLLPQQEVVFGRQSDCNFLLEAFPGISRHHFKITLLENIDTQEQSQTCRVEVLSSKSSVETSTGESVSHLELRLDESFALSPYTFKFSRSTHIPLLAPGGSGDHPASSNTEGYNDDITGASNIKLAPFLQIHIEGQPAQLVRLDGHGWVAGRDLLSDIVLEDAKASRRHFEIFQEEDGYHLRDLGSSNGTHLNGRRQESQNSVLLSSGDVIQVGQLNLVFQLRDLDFEAHIHNAPPTQLFGEIPPETHANEFGGVELLEDLSSKKLTVLAKKNKKNILIIAVVILCALAYYKNNSAPSETTEVLANEVVPGFEKLTAEQKRIVETAYNTATNQFLSQKFELALSQLEKVHRLVPAYKESRHYEELCLESRQLKIQREEIEKQKQDERIIRERVDSVIATCRSRANQIRTPDEMRECLAPAMDLNPNHPVAQQLIDDIEAKLQIAQQSKMRKDQHQSQIQGGERLYQKAKKLEKANDPKGAIAAYKAHIRSSFPDPDDLKAKSKSSITNLQNQLNSAKTKHFEEAKRLYSSGSTNKAIVECKKSLEIDPTNPEVMGFIKKLKTELGNKLKNIYFDSVLQERFGNIDAAKDNWRNIIEADVPDGEYYQKAKAKLSQYGAS